MQKPAITLIQGLNIFQMALVKVSWQKSLANKFY